jgi:hypothetical protein
MKNQARRTNHQDQVQTGIPPPGKKTSRKKPNQTVAPSATDKHQLSAAIKTACLATGLQSLQVQQRQINFVASFILDVDHKSYQHSNQTLTRSSRIGPSFG